MCVVDAHLARDDRRHRAEDGQLETTHVSEVERDQSRWNT